MGDLMSEEVNWREFRRATDERWSQSAQREKNL